MIHAYPTYIKQELDRQGEDWLTCDAEGCNKSAKVADAAAMPKDWTTSDPDGLPLNGAAQMCPDHAAKIVAPDDPQFAAEG